MKEPLILQFDEHEAEPISIGLLSLVKKLPDYEFFYKVNQLNSFQFSRVDDLFLHGQYYSYTFAVYYACSVEHKTGFYIISNRSIASEQIHPITEFFIDEQEVKFLLNNYQEVEFIIKTTDFCPSFSVILFPENSIFAIKELSIHQGEELYNTLFYYE